MSFPPSQPAGPDRHLKDIQGSSSSLLAGHHVAFGVTGSVAAVEAVRLARLLVRQGAEVHAVLSRAAGRLVSRDALLWATGNRVITRLTGRVEHIQLCGDEGLCSALLVAPATASTLARMALALDDTAVTTMATTALGAGRPVVVAPGMHDCMYRHPVVREHLERLEALGVRLVSPRFEEGKAKMASPEEIVEALVDVLGPADLAGRSVLITAGPTREPLDPVRFLSNRSSGRMGCELAREARRRGARVVLVYGPASHPPPPGVEVLRVETAAEMGRAVERELKAGPIDVFVGAAAVADFAPVGSGQVKLPSESDGQVLSLRPTPKILDSVRQWTHEALIVGFKAEAGLPLEGLLEAAERKRMEARADLVLANPVGLADRGFDSETNELWVLSGGPPRHLPLARKEHLARSVWDLLSGLLAERKGGAGSSGP